MLGNISWRAPFFGTATLMGIALIATMALLKSRGQQRQHVGITDSLKALRHPALLSLAAVAVTYNFGFFVLLAYSPFPIELQPRNLGLNSAHMNSGWCSLVGACA